jgi:hypothetical protein
MKFWDEPHALRAPYLISSRCMGFIPKVLLPRLAAAKGQGGEDRREIGSRPTSQNGTLETHDSYADRSCQRFVCPVLTAPCSPVHKPATSTSVHRLCSVMVRAESATYGIFKTRSGANARNRSALGLGIRTTGQRERHGRPRADRLMWKKGRSASGANAASAKNNTLQVRYTRSGET